MNLKIKISTAKKRTSKSWHNEEWAWGDFALRCTTPTRTPETAQEYAAMSRDRQGAIKDVGGFVGGFLAAPERKTANVLTRSIATLDIDYGSADTWQAYLQRVGAAAVIYTTHSHTCEAPRYRLVIPFAREVSVDEYEPVCRRIAELVGIEAFDATTYQVARLFYWPSVSANGDFFSDICDGPLLDPDDVLRTYTDPYNVAEWPRAESEGEVVRHELKRAEDPHAKPGIIGAWCRAHDVREVIETYLRDVYERVTDNRYTYLGGHTHGGVTVHDDGKFVYSFHDSDPAGGHAVNAFDLLRIHRFGSLDPEGASGDVARRPSFKAMQDFACKDAATSRLMLRERRQAAAEMFAGIDAGTPTDTDTGSTHGAQEEELVLEMNRDGSAKLCADNLERIMEGDPKLKGRIWLDEMTDSICTSGDLPWREEGGNWLDADDANLRIYLDKCYGLIGKERIYDAFTAAAHRHRRHPVREYLQGLPAWDGVPRLDTLICDTLGAENSELNRAMTRKQFTAAVARVMQPGCKHDYCLIIHGVEGAGKSTLLSLMAGEWFDDSFTTPEGKEGKEQLHGTWIIELSELASLKRAEAATIKNYISRCSDRFRPAYGRRTVDRPRQCVFFGTTNEDSFLRGDFGNRRFWIITIDPERRTVDDMREYVGRWRDQLWAEAMHRYRQGETLYLDRDLEAQARARQADHNEDNEDIIGPDLERYINTPRPPQWAAMSVELRQGYFRNPDLGAEGAPLEPCDRFSAIEFAREYCRLAAADPRIKSVMRQVNKYMKERGGWREVAASKHTRKAYNKTMRAWVRE